MKQKITGIFKQVYRNKILHRILLILLCVLSGILAVLGTMFVFGIPWMFRTWTTLTMEGLYSTLVMGAGGADNKYFLSSIPNIIVPALVGLAVYILMVLHFFKNNKARYLHYWNIFVCSISILSVVANCWMTWDRLEIGTFLANQGIIENDVNATEKSFIDREYVYPDSVVITPPEEPRNLIMIFMESMENTYSDYENGGAYETNYIPNLTRISQNNENFGGSDTKLLNGGLVMPYSTWTVAGLFTHTSGLPLNIGIKGNEMNSQNTFLPYVTTLGDILEDCGYNQIFQCGSTGEFAGRDQYFTTHGNYDIHDINYSYDIGELEDGYHVFWGYEDEKLFEYAKVHITEEASKGQPFNYTMLTVDTHFEDGYVCELCDDQYGDDQYANVISCSDRQVSEFVRWIQQQDFYENTTVVLIGDHLTMDSDFCQDVPSDYVRTVYTTYINSAVDAELKDTRRVYMEEDTFPTVLASLGFTIEGNRLALGTNLFSSVSTLVEEYGYDEVYAGISRKSDIVDRMNEDVDTEAADLKFRDHTAVVSIPVYDLANNCFYVSASDIISSTGVQQLQFSIYINDETWNALWVYGDLQPDGSYKVAIPFDALDFESGECHVEAYLYDDAAELFNVGSTVENIDIPLALPSAEEE